MVAGAPSPKLPTVRDRRAPKSRKLGKVPEGMYFMDAWKLDLDRLRDCYIHVADGKRLIPFCAYNLTAQNGETLYRR